MITIVNGDLLKSDCSVIGHQTNCMGVMGSGIAKQIRQQFPEAYQIFKEDVRTPHEKLGALTFVLTKGKLVFNLYGQLHYGRFNVVYTDYHALRSAIGKMMSKVCEIEVACDMTLKVGLPFGIGCGLGGGDIKIVNALLEEVSISHNKDIYLYHL